MIDTEALFSITYGLYVVCSGDAAGGNGYISNTVFQVTAEPPRFATCCNKDNHTAGFITRCGAFSVSVLRQDASSDLIGRFGYKSGKDTDKLSGMKLKTGITGVPVLLNESIATLEFRVVETIDVGTHLMFIADLVEAVNLESGIDPLTYLHYRRVKKGLSPKNAPTYIDPSKYTAAAAKGKTFKCNVCGYLYEEGPGITPFAELDDDFVCPICGAGKEDFTEIHS